jgi:hypothetical protein
MMPVNGLNEAEESPAILLEAVEADPRRSFPGDYAAGFSQYG